MKKGGYGDWTQPEKSLKKVFEKTIAIAQESFGITRSATGCQKKHNRMRKEYGAYVTKLKQSGRDGSDFELYNKPAFYSQVHELEHRNARHDPPAMMCTAMLGTDCANGASMYSSRKRIKREHQSYYDEAEKRNQERHIELLSGI